MKGDVQEIINKLIHNPDMPLKEVYAYCENDADLQLIIDEYQKAEERKFKETEGIYRFINSFALADYLKEIAYPFTPIESACLIYHSKWTDLKEKHEALQNIIDTMSKNKIETRALIKEYMEYQNDILARFGLSKENVYFYSSYIDADKWDDEFEKAIHERSKERVFASDYKRIIELKKRGADNSNMLFLLDKSDNVINIMPSERVEAEITFDSLSESFLRRIRKMETPISDKIKKRVFAYIEEHTSGKPSVLYAISEYGKHYFKCEIVGNIKDYREQLANNNFDNPIGRAWEEFERFCINECGLTNCNDEVWFADDDKSLFSPYESMFLFIFWRLGCVIGV